MRGPELAALKKMTSYSAPSFLHKMKLSTTNPPTELATAPVIERIKDTFKKTKHPYVANVQYKSKALGTITPTIKLR